MIVGEKPVRRYEIGEFITLKNPDPNCKNKRFNTWYPVLKVKGKIKALNCDLFSYYHDLGYYNEEGVHESQHLLLAAPNITSYDLIEKNPPELFLKVVYASGNSLNNINKFLQELYDVQYK
jgi:hypothetical protein